MKIKVTIEDSEKIDVDFLIQWLNEQFRICNISTGSDIWATSYEVIDE